MKDYVWITSNRNNEENLEYQTFKNLAQFGWVPFLMENPDSEVDLRAYPNLSPSKVIDLFEDLGWESDWEGDNGWDQDTWYSLSNPNYPYTLTLYYSGYYWSLSLSVKDEYTV